MGRVAEVFEIGALRGQALSYRVWGLDGRRK